MELASQLKLANKFYPHLYEWSGISTEFSVMLCVLDYK